MISPGHWFFHILILLLLFLSFNGVKAQLPTSAFSTDSVPEATIPPGDFIAFKDTLISGMDTFLVRKEVWVRDRDSLVITMDSILFLNSRIYLITDSIIEVKDTIVIVQDTILTRNERVLKGIQEFTKKNTLFSRLLRNVFVFEEAKRTVEGPIEQSDKVFESYEGKIIRNIDIQVLDVFGNKISDPDRKARGLLEKSGNFVHIKTQKWIVKNQLLFEGGDTINSLKASESERLLRANTFIYDARVIVKDQPDSDSVDVLVLVQDVWNISAGVDADPSKSNYGMSVKDVNFLGLGHQVSGQARFAPFLPKGYNYAGSYYVSNIYKTFLSGQLYYQYNYGQTTYGVGVNRDFISPAIKWAGGSNINWYNQTYRFTDSSDSLISVQPLRYIQGDAWLGYGWNLSGAKSSYKGTRFIISGRMVKSQFYDPPFLPDSIRTPYYTNNLFLASVGIIGRRFFRDSYIFRLGRTEDIPEGQYFSVTSGAENSYRGIRPYFGITGAWSRYDKKIGYLFLKAGIGGFNESNTWTQGVLGNQMLYFTPLLNLGTWKCRQFLGSRYTKGFNALYGNYVSVNSDQGLRGFRSGSLIGLKRFVLNYEANFYPPLNLVGFRIAFVLFADFAWITDSGKLINKDNFYPGFGAGLRIRNEHLIFPTIQLMLGFYPKGPSLGQQDYRLFETQKFFYNYYHFQFARPSILPLD